MTMFRRNWNCATLYSRLVNPSTSSSFHNVTHLRSSSSSNLHLSPSSVVPSKSTDLFSLARHYGNCYAELSKARLRFHFTFIYLFIFMYPLFPLIINTFDVYFMPFIVYFSIQFIFFIEIIVLLYSYRLYLFIYYFVN